MDPSKTGTIIREARKKLNMTQQDLADKLFVSDKAVSKWERGLCFPDISVLIPLTEILDLSLYDLLKGEKMKKEKVDEILKDTIVYSNNEIKRKQKKYVSISSVIIAIVILASMVGVIFSSTYFSEDNRNIRCSVKSDKILNINEYKDNFTSREDKAFSRKIEDIFFELSLRYPGRNLYAGSEIDYVELQYPTTYKRIVKAYKDENYVKRAMIHNAVILFTSVSDLNSFKIKFEDYKYVVKRKEVLNSFEMNNFDKIQNNESWEKYVSDKLESHEFVDKVFDNIFVSENVISENSK